MNIALHRRLQAARELVEIAIVETCLDALDVALRLEHPMLDEPKTRGDPKTLNRARAVTHFAGALRGALDAYRHAVDDALDHPHGDNDLPF